MVFKVRDKNIFWTRNGWKNNYYPRVFNMPRPINGDATMTVRCRYDHHSFLRSTRLFIQWYSPIETFLESVSSISTVTNNSSNSSCLNSEHSSRSHSLARPQSTCSNTEEYSIAYTGKKNG